MTEHDSQNFYLTPGEKYGVGTAESQTRYAMLMQQIADSGAMDMDEVRDALNRVSEHKFDSPFVSTEWSIVYNQTGGEVRYYHRTSLKHLQYSTA